MHTNSVVRKLLESRLLSSFPAVKIAFDNVTFTPPSDKYLRCSLLIAKPNDSAGLGSDYIHQQGTFQVFVMDKLGIGTAGANDTAGAISSVFYKRLTLQEGNVKVQVYGTPDVLQPVITADRCVVPIMIPLLIEVTN